MNDLNAEAAYLEARAASREASSAELDRLAALKLACGDAAGAVRAYEQIMAAGAAPQAALFNNLGAALLRAARFDEAIDMLQSALVLQPSYLRAQVNLGKALFEAGRIDGALAQLRAALVAQPGYVPALVNLGAAHAAAGDWNLALSALEAALRSDPKHIEALATFGLVKLWSGDTVAAINAFREAIALAPGHADAHANLAHALFVSGEWAAAWPHFEYRFRRTAHRAPLRSPPLIPRWDGRIRPDTELWLIGEQGLGDQLQFARYAGVLTAAGQQCVIACEPSLIKLLSQSGLGAEVRAWGSPPEATRACWLPLMSTPLWHGTTPVSVPATEGYLQAQPRLVERWRERMPREGLRIALSWAGNPTIETGAYAGRSPHLAALEPVLAVPGVAFVSLQKGAGESQIGSMPTAAAIHRFHDLDAGPDAFLDTSAILKCVDLLITSDTAVAHLGGALGVPTWLCLMCEPDWRWMRKGTTTPWYRSMRIFRQSVRGDWRGVFFEVAEELHRLRSSVS